MTIVIHDLEEAMTRIKAHPYDIGVAECRHCGDPLVPGELCSCQETCGIDPDDEPRDFDPNEETYPSRA